MRLHRSERLQERWYTLSPEVRRFVESLKSGSPKGVRAVPERPGRFEEFIAGVWIIWEVTTEEGETVIRVTISS